MREFRSWLLRARNTTKTFSSCPRPSRLYGQKGDEQQKSLDDLRAKVAEINQHFVELRNVLTDDEKRIRREKEEALKEALKGAAQRKLSKGEKLTLHELGALYEGEEE